MPAILLKVFRENGEIALETPGVIDDHNSILSGFKNVGRISNDGKLHNGTIFQNGYESGTIEFTAEIENEHQVVKLHLTRKNCAVARAGGVPLHCATKTNRIVDEGIEPFVRLLYENDFLTISSCAGEISGVGHHCCTFPYVIVISDLDSDIFQTYQRLFAFLKDNGYCFFHMTLESGYDGEHYELLKTLRKKFQKEYYFESMTGDQLIEVEFAFPIAECQLGKKNET